MSRKLKPVIGSKSVLFILSFIMGTSLCWLQNIITFVFFSFIDSLFSFSQSFNDANSIFMFVLQSLPFYYRNCVVSSAYIMVLNKELNYLDRSMKMRNSKGPSIEP